MRFLANISALSGVAATAWQFQPHSSTDPVTFGVMFPAVLGLLIGALLGVLDALAPKRP